jgi:hypothetical protein
METPLVLNRIYVAHIDDQWVRDSARAATSGLPAQTRPELVTGGIHGAFRPVRERIDPRVPRPLCDGAEGPGVPVTLAWRDTFIEEICPDRDTPCANDKVWAFLDRARESAR